MIRDIKKIANYYRRKFQTSDPFEIADNLNILYQIGNLKCEGCYMFLKNHRYIFLSDSLSYTERQLVMAHELGHAILHRKQNCYFIRNKTFLSTNKIEIEANRFAAELLIPDSILESHKDMTVSQLARSLGYAERIVELKIK